MTGRIYDCLVEEYGKASVFRDLESIRAGKDYRKDIEAAIRETSCSSSSVPTGWRRKQGASA